jgi:SPP1 gp7 family putative phage head morphogenesis protein
VIAERGSAESIGATADPLRMEEAVTWFRDRVPIMREEWDSLDQQARDRAFTVSGVTSLDVVEHVWRAIDRAVADGTTFNDFKRETTQQLHREWGQAISGRLETIFRNNVQSAYAAGRWEQMTDPDIRIVRPYWQFSAILDSRTTDICRPLDGMVRAESDPFWGVHYPPLHHQCRSGVISLTEDQAAAEGGISLPAANAPPQRGWGGVPDIAGWSPNASDYPAELWNAYQHSRDER